MICTQHTKTFRALCKRTEYQLTLVFNGVVLCERPCRPRTAATFISELTEGGVRDDRIPTFYAWQYEIHNAVYRSTVTIMTITRG